MEILLTILLAIAAFLLAAVPFSVIIGRVILRKDITQYGDGNPGSANVFRAGRNKAIGLIAVLLDVGKGIPFVLISHLVFGLPAAATVLIAVSAVMGHAYSPFRHWHGGKAICVTFGVMLALPQYDVLMTFIVFMLIGFIVIEIDGWKVVFGATGTVIFLLATHGFSWETVLMLVLDIILIIKHFNDLRTLPHFQGFLVRWVQSKIRSAM
jgi:acyl phosphate:glycerol-3-phosphate acyltransferase